MLFTLKHLKLAAAVAFEAAFSTFLSKATASSLQKKNHRNQVKELNWKRKTRNNKGMIN